MEIRTTDGITNTNTQPKWNGFCYQENLTNVASAIEQQDRSIYINGLAKTAIFGSPHFLPETLIDLCPLEQAEKLCEFYEFVRSEYNPNLPEPIEIDFVLLTQYIN